MSPSPSGDRLLAATTARQDEDAGRPRPAASSNASRDSPNTKRTAPLSTQQPGPKVLTFALKHRPRATRASVPKVRTGCKTCKKRHVKCDEAKPSCDRCIKWQGFCEGYDAPVAESPPAATAYPIRTTQRHSKGTTPDAYPASTAVAIKREDDAVILRGAAFLTEPSYERLMFSSAWEKTYFDRWLTLTPNLAGGWFNSHLWSVTIPQLCRDEPAIRLAAIAVGAMAQAMVPPAVDAPLYTAPASSAVPHYRNALTFYGHALRLLRLQNEQQYLLDDYENKRDPADNIRVAVLSCLLFVCFEILQGNYDGAVRHLTHGLQIVDRFVARHTAPSRPKLSHDGRQSWVIDCRPLDASGKFEPNLQYTQQPSQQGQEGQLPKRPSDSLNKLLTKSPAPYILENEVLQMFRRLDHQAWSLGFFRVRRTQPADIIFQALDALDPLDIPLRFEDLDEAREWWDVVQHWILQFPRLMVAALQQYMDEHPEEVEEAEAKGCMLDLCDVPGARTTQKKYLECLESWHAAFWPLYDSARRQRHTREIPYLQAISLHIQYLLLFIGIHSLVFSDYEAMYQMTPQFREINRLGAILMQKQYYQALNKSPSLDTFPSFRSGISSNSGVSSKSNKSGGGIFTMDSGPTLALFIASCKCRSEEVRSEATRLLSLYPRRDGFWNTKVMWAVAEWNRSIEAGNETEGDLFHQWLRLRQREGIFDNLRPVVYMTGYVKDPEHSTFRKETHEVWWAM